MLVRTETYFSLSVFSTNFAFLKTLRLLTRETKSSTRSYSVSLDKEELPPLCLKEHIMDCAKKGSRGGRFGNIVQARRGVHTGNMGPGDASPLVFPVQWLGRGL